MKKIITFIGLFAIIFLLVRCEKDDMYSKFKPEILFMEERIVSGGNTEWIVNPYLKETTLSGGISEYKIKARVSSPNKLSNIKIISNNGQVLQNYDDFTLSPNVKEIEYLVSNITSTVIIKVEVKDQINNVSVREFTIKKQ